MVGAFRDESATAARFEILVRPFSARRPGILQSESMELSLNFSIPARDNPPLELPNTVAAESSRVAT